MSRFCVDSDWGDSPRTSNWSQTELHVEGGDDSRFSMTTLGNDLEVDARHRFAATTLHATDAPPADALERQGHAAIFHHGTMQVIPSRRDMDAGALSEDWDHTMILDRGMISRMVESEGALAELDAYAHGGRPVLAAIAEESEEESAAFDTSRSLVLLPEPPVNTGSSKQHGAQTLAMSESAASLESGAATAVCDSSDEFSVSTRNGRQSIDTQSSITTVRRAVRAMLEDIVDSVADSLSLRDSRSVGGDRPGSTRTTGHRIGGYSDVGNEGNPAAAAAGLSQPLQEPEYNTETAVGLDVEHAQVCGSKLSFHSTAMCNSGPSQSSHHAQGEDDGGSESIRQDPGSPAPKKCSGHCLANKDSRQQQDRQSHQELKKRLEVNMPAAV